MVSVIGVLALLIMITVMRHPRDRPVEARPALAQRPSESPAAVLPPRPAQARPIVPPRPVAESAPVVPLPNPPSAAPVVRAPVVVPPTPVTIPAWRDDQAARHPRGETQCAVITGSSAIATRMTRLPSVRCDWMIPVGRDGVPLATAADVVALFPYPTEDEPLRAGHAHDLARRYGFTVMSLAFPGMADVDARDRSHYYYFPESGSGQAWLDAWRHVRTVAGLPERRLLLFGRSGGGSAAHQFAEAHPEAVDAYAEEAGRVFAEHPRGRMPVLILHGEFDYTLDATLAFERALGLAGNQPLRVSFRPKWEMRGAAKALLTHGAHPEHFRLMQAWLAGIADLRLANSGKLPPISTWPSFAGRSFPDAAAIAAFRATAPPLERIGTAVVARPAPTIAAKGLVLLLVDEFSVDPLDVIFDAQMLADDGFICAAASSDLADPARALSAVLPTADPGKKLPIVIAVQGSARHLATLVTAAGARLRGCAMMRARAVDIAQARRAIGADLKLLVLASEAEEAALRARSDVQVDILGLRPQGHSDGRIHLDRIRRLSERCRDWLGDTRSTL